MNFKKLFFAFTFFIFLFGCNQQSSTNQITQTNNTDTLFQVSTLQALMQGYYYPVSTVGELKQNGDFGIGCFEAVNGELIMVDGVVYQAIHDSSILVPDNNTTIPYATVTFFNNDISFELENVSSMENLKEQLNKIVNENGNNIFYFVRIDGTFDTLYYRSEYAQKEPYKPLAKAMETDQTFFNKENETGTIVGLYCPDFMDKLNSPGWHFHFITQDKKSGGHLLNLSSKKIAVQLDKKTDFKMILPEEEKFQNMQLSKDMSKDMIEVETNTKYSEPLKKETNYFPAIDRYLTESIGSKYAKGEHCIPIHSIVRVDERDAEDIKVWGDFWVFNYNQVGDTLECVSGGSHPGLLHIRQTEKGFEVTAFDQVEDGSRYLPTAKKIFGDKFNAFKIINSDEKNRERLRAEGLATYVKKHNIAATKYKDYGWPEKQIPLD